MQWSCWTSPLCCWHHSHWLPNCWCVMQPQPLAASKGAMATCHTKSLVSPSNITLWKILHWYTTIRKTHFLIEKLLMWLTMLWRSFKHFKWLKLGVLMSCLTNFQSSNLETSSDSKQWSAVNLHHQEWCHIEAPFHHAGVACIYPWCMPLVPQTSLSV